MKPFPTPLLVAVVGAVAIVGFQFPVNIAERSYSGFPAGTDLDAVWSGPMVEADITRVDDRSVVLTTAGGAGCPNYPTGIVATSASEVTIHVRAPTGFCSLALVYTSYELRLPSTATAQELTVTVDYWPTGASRILKLE